MVIYSCVITAVLLDELTLNAGNNKTSSAAVVFQVVVVPPVAGANGRTVSDVEVVELDTKVKVPWTLTVPDVPVV